MIHCLQSLVLFIATLGSSSDLIYYLVLLLLLSGDVELNPGPMIDDQPDIFLLLQWLEPLVDWQPFGRLLPEITQHDITTIQDFEIDAKESKEGLFSKWLKKNPTATWRDVLNALTKREEINLLQAINDQLQVHQCTGGMVMYLYINKIKNIKNGKVVGLNWKKVKKQEDTCKLVWYKILHYCMKINAL